MGKIRVEELAQQMGLPSKEVLFLLQSIGVDVKSPQAALDETTVMAILQGKTHAPKQLLVRDTETRAARPTKSALSRIKIVDKPALPKGAGGTSEEALTLTGGAPEAEPANDPARETPPPSSSAAEARPRTPEPARTAVVAPEPEAQAQAQTQTRTQAQAQAPVQAQAPKPLPRKIILPPRPTMPPRPMAGAAGGAPRPSAAPGGFRPTGPARPTARPSARRTIRKRPPRRTPRRAGPSPRSPSPTRSIRGRFSARTKRTRIRTSTFR